MDQFQPSKSFALPYIKMHKTSAETIKRVQEKGGVHDSLLLVLSHRQYRIGRGVVGFAWGDDDWMHSSEDRTNVVSDVVCIIIISIFCLLYYNCFQRGVHTTFPPFAFRYTPNINHCCTMFVRVLFRYFRLVVLQ